MRALIVWGMIVAAAALARSPAAAGEEQMRDFTCFQVAAPYSEWIDVGSDVAIVYGTDPSFGPRVARWRQEGYTVGMMTGIAWGGYAEYYGTGDAFKKSEVQTRKDGSLFMHGHNVGYNVPTPAYIEYIKKVVEPAIDQGIQAIYLEEPEFWAESGWSEAFRKEWQAFYGEPWQAPDSSVNAQYRASKLKYEMYFQALKEVFAHIKSRARERGIRIECHVPTHSLISYAHWRIVSPESHLMDLPEMDGYIAQVWTGTARTPNVYRGVKKERTFETAFLEYGQMLAMVRPTRRKVWFLADPIEDNPNRSWADYKRNYECTVIASLLWPEVHRYEVMPWPDRIFKGTYPDTDLELNSGERKGIPADYATQILIVINALNDMEQEEVEYDTGSRGIGVLVSDTLMFQRAAPEASDADMGGFYGLALPLLKAGVPVEVIQLENVLQPGSLSSCEVLLLSYENQKPLKPEYHQALEQWVRSGGCLLYVGDGSDPYHRVAEWWNDNGATDAKADEDLFRRVKVTLTAQSRPQPVGKGYVRVCRESPSALTRDATGAKRVRSLVTELLAAKNQQLHTQNYLCVRRGPYVIASVLEESVSEEPLVLEGLFVDLFDPSLPVVKERNLEIGQRTLLYDLNWATRNNMKAKVVAAGARIKQESLVAHQFSFTARGPAGTTANARVLLPRRPKRVKADEAELPFRWDEDSSTLWFSFSNEATEVKIGIEL